MRVCHLAMFPADPAAAATTSQWPGWPRCCHTQQCSAQSLSVSWRSCSCSHQHCCSDDCHSHHPATTLQNPLSFTLCALRPASTAGPAGPDSPSRHIGTLQSPARHSHQCCPWLPPKADREGVALAWAHILEGLIIFHCRHGYVPAAQVMRRAPQVLIHAWDQAAPLPRIWRRQCLWLHAASETVTFQTARYLHRSVYSVVMGAPSAAHALLQLLCLLSPCAIALASQKQQTQHRS